MNTSLKDFLIDFEKKNPVRFFFLENWIESYTITPDENNKPLREALTNILGQEVSFYIMFDYAVIFSVDPKTALHRQDLIQNAVIRKSDVQQVTIGDKNKRSSSRNVTVRGVLKSKETNTPLTGVVVELENESQVTTNNNGAYEITMPQGEHVLTYKISGYEEKLIILKIYENGVINFSFDEQPVFLEEVTVTDQAITNNRIGESSIKLSGLKRAPTFLGEVDLVKSIQTQSGVTTVSEIASGFNVRGGSADQNLVLYDGVPIFNTSHALGLFTAFNSYALRNVTFYKGGIPVEYGGRASSVLNIDAAEGNPNKWTINGGIGIIASDVSIGGPIKRDTTLIAASFRSTYSDWILNTVKSKYNLDKTSLSFYDASLKLSHKINRKTKIIFSGYSSSDRFKLLNDTAYRTRNYAASLRMDRTFNENFFGSASLSFGRYAYRIETNRDLTGFSLDYSITYPSLKFDFNYEGKHKLAFGLHNTFYSFNPGTLKPTTRESNSKTVHMPEARALESAIYFSDAFRLYEKFFIEAGVRYSIFTRLGGATVYQYASGEPREPRNIVDSVQYGKNEVIKMYHGIEPRLSLRYEIDPSSSIKLGYNRMYQYLHMISNTAAITPVDIWQPTDKYFKPQVADQISIGYYKTLKENMFEVSSEVFYKEVRNVLDFKDGAELILNKYIETALLPGKAHSYGIEISASKVTGKFIVSTNYTFSRSFRNINGKFDSEKINEGNDYPSNFDQPHIVNINWRHEITKRVFFSGNFTYHTGRPTSIPVRTYSIDGIPISDFNYRNQYRIPDYHRMDIAFIFEPNHKVRKEILDGSWVISFYNVYARKNVYTVFYTNDGNGNLKPYKLSVIGTIIPSLTYRLKF